MSSESRDAHSSNSETQVLLTHRRPLTCIRAATSAQRPWGPQELCDRPPRLPPPPPPRPGWVLAPITVSRGWRSLAGCRPWVTKRRTPRAQVRMHWGEGVIAHPSPPKALGSAALSARLSCSSPRSFLQTRKCY